MNTPLISIIIPVYKVEPYLERCIRSVVNQTYTNLEIILIDDGSPDKCPQICDAWADKDARISVIHTENHGVSHARNIGLDATKGEFIGFVDADDWIDNDMYEMMVNGIAKEKVDICIGGRVLEIENSQMIDPKRGQIDFQHGFSQVLSREATLIEAYSYSHNKIFDATLCDKLFRRALLLDIRFDEHISQWEDTLFFWQLMKKVKSTLYLPLHKYHYLMRETSAIHEKINHRFLERSEVFSRMKQSASSEPHEIKRAIDTHYAIHLVNSMRIMLLLDDKKYEQQIHNGQTHIRNYIIDCFSMKIYPFSFRLKFLIGALFFCFPFYICRLLRQGVRLQND